MDLVLLAGHPLFVATALVYLAAFVCYALVWYSTKESIGKIGTALMAVAACLLYTSRCV